MFYNKKIVFIQLICQNYLLLLFLIKIFSQYSLNILFYMYFHLINITKINNKYVLYDK